MEVMKQEINEQIICLLLDEIARQKYDRKMSTIRLK